MPYARTSELPEAVRNALPPRAQRVFMSAFNGAIKRGLSEERAYASAWGAVHSGFKKPETGGKWVKKVRPPPDQLDMLTTPTSDNVINLFVEVAKREDGSPIVNEDQNLVFGWLSVIEENGEPVVDRQGHVIDEDTLEKAAYDFLLNRGVVGEMHSRIGIGDGVAASIPFTKEIQKALGIDLKKVGWFIVVKVDAEAFAKVKSGTLRAFSLGGVGVLEDMAEAA